jgi:hypothetical protein
LTDAARLPAALRGTAAGLLTAALTLAAHALGGGVAVVPSGPAIVQLLLVALTVAGAAALLPRTGDVRVVAVVLAVLLGAGQLAGHGVLAAGAHVHAAGAPRPLMVAAHLVAVVLGAVLIGLGDRLCRMLTRVTRRILARLVLPVPAAPPMRLPVADLLPDCIRLFSSLSHRGPPVAA